MTIFIREFLEVFCFSSADLKSNKPLCSAVYCGPEPDVFKKFIHNSSSSKTSTFRLLGTFSNFALAFYLVYDRNTANFKNSFDSPKAISFQVQLYRLPSDLLWIAALFYRVVAFALFAQISLFFVVESAFYSFFAPAFRAFKFFNQTFTLHQVWIFSNARGGSCYKEACWLLNRLARIKTLPKTYK